MNEKRNAKIARIDGAAKSSTRGISWKLIPTSDMITSGATINNTSVRRSRRIVAMTLRAIPVERVNDITPPRARR